MRQSRRWIRWGRNQHVPADRSTISHEEHVNNLVIPDVREGALVAVVCDLVIVDHGTGLGASVSSLLGLDASAVVHITGGWNVVVGERLTFALHPVPSDPDHVGVASFDSQVQVHVARPEVADHILSLLTRRVLDTQDRLPHLHGGAVADPDGQVVLILGSSGAGKSTLTAHLAAADGWRLITDEQITLFPGQELVGGFTRPVAIKRPGFAYVPPLVPPTEEPGSVRLLPAALLGCGRVLAGHPALIVLPEREDDVKEVTWELVEPAASVVELCANNLDLVRRPAETLQAFGWLASTIPTLRLRYEDAISGAEAIRGVLAKLLPVPAVRCGLVQSSEANRNEGTKRTTDDDAVRIGEDAFAVQVGPELILFHRSTRELLRLDAEAALLWTALLESGRLRGVVDAYPDQELNDLVDYLAVQGFLAADNIVSS